LSFSQAASLALPSSVGMVVSVSKASKNLRSPFASSFSVQASTDPFRRGYFICQVSVIQSKTGFPMAKPTSSSNSSYRRGPRCFVAR